MSLIADGAVRSAHDIGPAYALLDAVVAADSGFPAGYDDVTVDSAWDPRATHVAGLQLVGWCFMFYPDGRALPAR